MDYRSSLSRHNRIVVKVGTTTLTYSNGRINLRRIEEIAFVLSDLRNSGKEIVLVSSGAIAVGAERLLLKERPRDTRGKQAASSVGQIALMQIYQKSFMSFNQKIAQILLTKDVFEDAERKQNAKNTFATLLDMGVIPIVNENDAVATDELGFSENDRLSAYVATLVGADLLIILSDIDGFYAKDPKKHEEAEIIRYVEDISRDVFAMAGTAGSRLGSGGMTAKLSAAKLAMDAGIDTVMAHGENPKILYGILGGEEVGTLFKAVAQE